MNAPVSAILDFFFPPKCVFCEKLLQKGERGWCLSCGQDLPENDRLHLIPGAEACRAPLRYEGVARSAMIRYKFSGRSSYAEPFSALLYATVRTTQAELITWIPVSARRRLERGYDQTELLARALSKRLGIPAVKLLKKKHTKRQSGVGGPEERRKNIKDAFSVISPEQIQGKRLLLLDDICTTGATLNEAVSVLNRSGASAIECAVLMMTQE